MPQSLVRRSLVASGALGLILAAVVAGCGGTEPSDSASDDDLTAKNLTATSFGLADKEIALTLDDGPGPRTVELAEWLAENKVPATFFMVGKNAKADPASVKKVAELSNANNGLFIIANHSMTHTTPLPKQGVNGSIDEIANADAILKDSIALSQKVGYPSPIAFFRPPYGAFTSLGAANVAKVNENASAGRYTGPVFWDIGGELSATTSADWACWGKVTMDRCIDGYVAEAKLRKRGVMLAHDVHSKTVDMLTGKGTANGRSLIKELRAAGFKFASLRAHEAAVQNFGNQAQQLASNAEVTIDAAVNNLGGGRVVVDVRTAGDATIKVSFDQNPPNASFRGDKQIDVTLAPGQHFVTVSAIGANNAVVKQERYTFIVAADIAQNGVEANGTDNAVCVKFDLLKVGSQFNLFHGKLDCGAAGAQQAPGTSECYRFKATLSASRNPQLVGASEWSTELDMTYASDPSDKSKVGFQIDARTGEMENGRRFNWKIGTTSRPDATFQVTSSDCNAGIWRGTIRYASGSSEEFLYKRAQ